MRVKVKKQVGEALQCPGKKQCVLGLHSSGANTEWRTDLRQQPQSLLNMGHEGKKRIQRNAQVSGLAIG